MPVLTSKDIVEIAINICNEDEFKSDIFSVRYSNQKKLGDCKKEWDERVENRALNYLRDYRLKKSNRESAIGAVFSISLRMLVWIEYHVGTFNFPRDFCIEFLDSSLFTPEGIIDAQKVVTRMSERTFSNLQDFQLASYYCQMERIPELFQNLAEEDRKLVYNADNPQLIRQPDIVKFWSYYYMGDIDKLRGNLRIDHYRLKSAITSGSQIAVEYCLRMISLKTKQRNLGDTVINVVTHRVQTELKAVESNSNFVNDRVVFRNRMYSCKGDSWAPDYFSNDIFHALFCNMSVSEKMEMIRKLFIIIKFDILALKNVYVKVLELFLCWPYQDHFLESLRFSWEHLPKRAYGSFLLEIVNRIKPKMGHFWYGEDKICNYRRLLMYAWATSPPSLKRYVFSEKKRFYQNKDEPQGSVIVKEGKQLLFRMFHLNGFTETDRRNVMTLIESATHVERMKFLFAPEGNMVCIMLLETERFDLFEELISICFTSPENAQKYRKKFSFVKSKNAFLEFVKVEKWDEAEETLKWGELTKEEMDALKKQIILCEEGMQTCRELCLIKSNAADRFVHWCLPSEKSVKDFKHSLLHDDEGMQMCTNFLNNNVTTLADKLVNWCLSSQDDIQEFKRTLGLKAEVPLNSNLEGIHKCSDNEFPNRIADWTNSETLLSWCFESESEVNNFKRKLLENSRQNIILKCIQIDKWDVADQFLSWLNLSPDEVKKAKKEQFFTCSSTSDLFDDLMNSSKNDRKFVKSDDKQRAIERFLNWFLVDRESINEFTSRYKCYRTDSCLQNVIKKLIQDRL